MGIENIVINVSIGVSTIIATYFIGIRIKFAKDIKTEMKKAKYFSLITMFILANLWVLYSLVLEIRSFDFSSKASFILIILYFFFLYHSFISYFVSQVFKQQIATSNILQAQNEILTEYAKYLHEHKNEVE